MDWGQWRLIFRMLNRTHDFEEPGISHSSVDEVCALLKENRAGKRRGIYSVCSANRLVLEAAFAQAADDRSPLLIEATCNQVNQEGGYTGMTPVQFRDYVHSIAQEMHFPTEKLLLGGDHLGPNPWRVQSAATAMDKACAMVSAYAAAGFSKIHLDASMSCGDDPRTLASAENRKPRGSALRGSRICGARPCMQTGLRHRDRGANARRGAGRDGNRSNHNGESAGNAGRAS